jgi:hypothetical protein
LLIVYTSNEIVKDTCQGQVARVDAGFRRSDFLLESESARSKFDLTEAKTPDVWSGLGRINLTSESSDSVLSSKDEEVIEILRKTEKNLNYLMNLRFWPL